MLSRTDGLDDNTVMRPHEADHLWARGRAVVVGNVVMTTVLVFLKIRFTGLVDPLLLNGWICFMAASVAMLSAMLAMFNVPGVRRIVPPQIWRGARPIFGIWYGIGIAASVWILLPPVDQSLRMLMIFLYFWFMAMVMMAGGTRIDVSICLLLIASLVGFIVTADMPHATELVGFLAMAGWAIVSIRRLIWRAADEAAEGRALSERASEMLENALRIVREERDAKTRFIASASHDLQQPVQAASLFVDQIIEGADTPARARAVVGARRAFAAVQGQLEAMLDHLRLDAGAVIAKPVDVVIDSVIADVVAEHEPAARHAGLTIAQVDGRFVANADAQLLRRAIGNLVANAVRHSRGTRLLIGCRTAANGVDIWVIDNGRGIASAESARLFEEYVQGPDEGGASSGGFGLGLSSARRLMELQGGKATLDMRWTNGSAFRLHLPLARRSCAIAAPITAPELSCKAA